MKDLEFLPENHIRARQNQRLRLTRLWLLTLLTVSMVCWTFYSKSRIAGAEARLAVGKLAAEDSKVQADVVATLRVREALYSSRQTMVDKLAGGQRRTDLLDEIVRCLPKCLALTRVEIDLYKREKRGARVSVSRSARRRGGAQQPTTETVNRIRVEGISMDDMAMTRFVQDVVESKRIEKGEVAYTRDSTFRGKEVRVFAATFFAPIEEPAAPEAALSTAKGERGIAG